MNDSLTKDEYEALAQIRKARKGERPSACVARNAKALIGLKAGEGFDLTERGRELLADIESREGKST